MQARQEIRRPVLQVLALVLALMAALLLAGMAGYLLRGANSSRSTTVSAPSVGAPAVSANPAGSAGCEGYACTLEGERELSERQAVQAAVERQAAQEEREAARLEKHASRDI
jgi:hypothetical protein